MKRIISLLISAVLIFNLLGSALMASATEIKNDQGAFVNYDALVTGNYDIIPESTINDKFIDIAEGPSLYPVYAKQVYQIHEQITVQMKLLKSLVGVDSIIEVDGFSIIDDVTTSFDATSGCQIYNVTLTYDGVAKKPYFSFGVITDKGTTVYAKVFGYYSDHGLFLSKSSHDAAKDASYYYLVETEQITINEYNELLQQEYSKEGTVVVNRITHAEETITSSNSETFMLTTPVSDANAPTTVTGNLVWIDDNDVRHPLQYTQIAIWDLITSELLEITYTDVSGHYSVSFTDEHTNHDISVEIYPAGENSRVEKGNGQSYLFTCPTEYDVTPGDTINIDWEIDMTSDLGRAFQISQAVNVAAKYAKEMNGSNISSVRVIYPHEEEGGCFYRQTKYDYWVDKSINICGLQADRGCPESYASWDVIMHEYGHHVQAEFGISNSPDGLGHYFNENLATRYNNKDIGIRLAWGEAYASVFSGMAQAYFAYSLQNIDTVGDAVYESYNSATMDYENVLDNHRQGEACEGSIIGILWDLYDNVVESHDTTSFTHYAYWNMITNSGATTLSEFCNYFTNTYATNKDLALGKLLSYYKVSASNLTANMDGATPSFSWTANGVTVARKNNRFDLIVLNINNSVTLRINNLTSTSYTLTDAQWQTVLNSYGTTYTVVIVAYQTASPLTGGYYSESLTIAKPINNPSSTIVQTGPSSVRYSEIQITLTPGCYYDLHVTFGITGSKLIQTFGRKDTVIEMYDAATGKLIVEPDIVDDNGFRFNALVRYYTYENTEYIIRIRLWDENDFGTVKIAMTPASGVYDYWDEVYETYEDILNFGESTSLRWDAYCELNYASIITFTPSKTGLYTFAITSEVDTYLYVIDPRSSDLIAFGTDYDDDSGSGRNPLLTRTLEAGIPYLVIYSGYNIANENYVGDLMLNIWLEEDTE